MRTSLLLRREEFGKILSLTLECYLKSVTKREYQITWFDKISKIRKLVSNTSQVWYGNIYLNFFSISENRSSCFENQYKEFSVSKSFFKKIPQKYYAKCAISKMFRVFLSQVAFSINPGIINATGCVIIPGNRRIRIIDYNRNVSIVILKMGYSQDYLINDVMLRNNIVLDFVPMIRNTDIKNNWYEEDIITGTPINRIPKLYSIPISKRAMLALLDKIIIPTLFMMDFHEYMGRLLWSIDKIKEEKIRNSNLIQVLTILVSSAQCLIRKIPPDLKIPISLTHGDFQAANILARNDGEFYVIDWENVSLRHAAFDLIVNIVGSREKVDWFLNIKNLFENNKNLMALKWPGMNNNFEIYISVISFIMEELLFILMENFEKKLIKIDSYVAIKIKKLIMAMGYLNQK